MKKIELEVPFFPGFYNTGYDPSEQLYDYTHHNEEEKIYLLVWYGKDVDFETEFEIDYDKYQKDIGEKIISILKDELPPWIENITYSHIESPKYYNYSTDKLYADFEFTDDIDEKILKFIKENYDYCKKRIEERWTSRIGWTSFISNNIEKWIESFENDTADEDYCTYVEDITRYWYELNHDKRGCESVEIHIMMNVLEDIYISEYIIYDRQKWINYEKREELIKENEKLIAEYQDEYDRIVKINKNNKQ